MAKIAMGMHLESSVHEIQCSIRYIQDRLSAQQSQLQELQQLSQTTTTKAELHAVMACLTYKHMGLALPSNALHEIITEKFAKSEQLRPSEVKGYLANPFEALASMAERINRIENLRKEEMEKQEEESMRQREEIVLLKRALSDQDQRMTQLFSDVGASNIAIQKLVQQQRQQEKNLSSKPPLFTSGGEELSQEDRIAFLEQPLDMETYWNIPEEEGLDGLPEGDEGSHGSIGNEENDDISLRKMSEAQITTPLPHIPSPEESTSNGLLTPTCVSQASLNNDSSESLSTVPLQALDISSASVERKASSVIPSITPNEPSSSTHRPSHRPSFMSVRRKLSAVTALSQPGDLSLPPTKARTSIVKTIPKSEPIPPGAMGNYVTISQFQEFLKERAVAESGIKNRLKSVEIVTAQVTTLHEALKILSEEIRVTSEELTGSMKKDIEELKYGQLQSLQEVLKVVENCFLRIKNLQTEHSKPKAGNSLAMESVHHEMRILQQNMESMRTQLITQSTKQGGKSFLSPTLDPFPQQPPVPQEDVMKIATDISKLDNSVGVLYQRCSSLQEEFLLHQEAIRSNDVQQQQLQQSLLGEDSERRFQSGDLHDQTRTNHPVSAPPQHISSLSLGGERTLQTSELHEFHESKLQELHSISIEIKQLQEEIHSIKSASSEIFERYHIHLPQTTTTNSSSQGPTQHHQPLTDRANLTDTPLPRGQDLVQYATNDSRFQRMQADLTELREKVEQIYYLSLSAVSMAQQFQQQQSQGMGKATEERNPSPGLSLQQLNFPENIRKKESNQALPPRPSVSASASRRKPGSAPGKQRPNSSIGVSRGKNSSDDLLTPPTISFVDTIEPPLRPPRPSNTNVDPVVKSPRAKGKPVVTSRYPSPQLMLLAGSEATHDENSLTSPVMVLPMDGLRIGESNSSVWERDESLESSDDVMNRLPNALLYGSITVRDTVKYDKERQQDDAWYRTFQTPPHNTAEAAVNSSKQKQQQSGGYAGSLTEYTGDWKMPSNINSERN